ncbi:sensor histidine kinase, partial [Actinomycetota bacterium Odt1-20B]
MPRGFPPRWRLRPRSIRAKVVTLLTVPVVSLMALWGHAAVTTASQVSDAQQLQDVNSRLLRPISDFTTAVQDERRAALTYLAAPGGDHPKALDAAKSRTDKAVVALRRGVHANSTDTAALDSALPGRLTRLLDSADSLAALRTHPGGLDAALDAYSTPVRRAFAVRASLAGADRAGAGSDARAVLELARSREALSRQVALFGAAQATDGGMTAGQYRGFIGDVALQRGLADGAVDDLRPADASAYRKVLGSPGATDLKDAQDAVQKAGAAHAVAAVSAERWRSDTSATLAGLARAEAGARTAGTGAQPYSLETLGSSGLAVVLGLLGVLLSLFLSVRIGRGLVADLTGLRNSALQMASTRLPAAMRRIHNGEDVDLDREAPLPRTAERDEVGQVGAALTTVQRAALRAVAGRAAVLTGVSGVYVSLARRSQVLLHRQLELLDTMERRTQDPVDLEDLFRLDHLTTRMRRHAESLLILSGSAPGRAWRSPVPLLDAVRAGIAETADIERVQLGEIPDLRLAGAAVADLVHLVAELAENAAQFSPPHTPVVVRGEEVGAGAILEIEDRGLGMGEEALAAANGKIRATDIDLLDSRQLGLFVVNRLAQRQHVDVSLRRSVYGGVLAVVFLPKELLEAPHPGLRPHAPGAGESTHLPHEGDASPRLPQAGEEQDVAPELPRRTAIHATATATATATDTDSHIGSDSDSGSDLPTRTAARNAPADGLPTRTPAGNASDDDGLPRRRGTSNTPGAATAPDAPLPRRPKPANTDADTNADADADADAARASSP